MLASLRLGAAPLRGAAASCLAPNITYLSPWKVNHASLLRPSLTGARTVRFTLSPVRSALALIPVSSAADFRLQLPPIALALITKCQQYIHPILLYGGSAIGAAQEAQGLGDVSQQKGARPAA